MITQTTTALLLEAFQHSPATPGIKSNLFTTAYEAPHHRPWISSFLSLLFTSDTSPQAVHFLFPRPSLHFRHLTIGHGFPLSSPFSSLPTPHHRPCISSFLALLFTSDLVSMKHRACITLNCWNALIVSTPFSAKISWRQLCLIWCYITTRT